LKLLRLALLTHLRHSRATGKRWEGIVLPIARLCVAVPSSPSTPSSCGVNGWSIPLVLVIADQVVLIIGLTPTKTTWRSAYPHRLQRLPAYYPLPKYLLANTSQLLSFSRFCPLSLAPPLLSLATLSLFLSQIDIALCLIKGTAGQRKQTNASIIRYLPLALLHRPAGSDGPLRTIPYLRPYMSSTYNINLRRPCPYY
jgi:hypothetical protein